MNKTKSVMQKYTQNNVSFVFFIFLCIFVKLDELIEILKEPPPKRCRCGITVNFIDSLFNPDDSIMFVSAKIPKKFSRKGSSKVKSLRSHRERVDGFIRKNTNKDS
jgi:hypothetical protein